MLWELLRQYYLITLAKRMQFRTVKSKATYLLTVITLYYNDKYKLRLPIRYYE